MRSLCLLALILPVLAACDRGASAPREVLARTCHTPPDAPVLIKGGAFDMGSSRVYAEEGPPQRVRVKSFLIDRHEVTNRQFAVFVAATGYRTVAERPVDAALYPDAPPEMLKPGSAVFTPPNTASRNYVDWWTYVPGAEWRKPYGPMGSPAVADEPVVHIAYEDAAAYAAWAGGRLPTEAEWEYAARAGAPTAKVQPAEANSWQGAFPLENEKTDGFSGIAPVGCYKPNGQGLYDMIGNVWEWTADWYAPGHKAEGPPTVSDNPAAPGVPSHVIKGGSFLCAPNYCMRYRPEARAGQDQGLGASNIGFRVVRDVPT